MCLFDLNLSLKVWLKSRLATNQWSKLRLGLVKLSNFNLVRLSLVKLSNFNLVWLSLVKLSKFNLVRLCLMKFNLVWLA